MLKLDQLMIFLRTEGVQMITCRREMGYGYLIWLLADSISKGVERTEEGMDCSGGDDRFRSNLF